MKVVFRLNIEFEIFMKKERKHPSACVLVSCTYERQVKIKFEGGLKKVFGGRNCVNLKEIC